MVVGILAGCYLASINLGALKAGLLAVFGIYVITKVYVLFFAPIGLSERYKKYRRRR